MGEKEIRDIFSDEAYVSSLLALDTASEVQASLAEKGLDLSEEEIKKLLDSIQNYSESDEELSETSLENVTGGVLCEMIFLVVMGLIVGTGVGGGIGLITNAVRRRW
jgi:hypothetical protein